MSSFTKPLTTTYIGNGRRRVARKFDYFVGVDNKGYKITVPKGFITDFASVPFPASMLIPKDGDYNQASVLHDYLYSKLGDLGDIKYTRFQCDRIFLNAMKVLKVNFWKRRIMYRAVRVGAWIGWNIHAKRIKKSLSMSKHS